MKQFSSVSVNYKESRCKTPGIKSTVHATKRERERQLNQRSLCLVKYWKRERGVLLTWADTNYQPWSMSRSKPSDLLDLMTASQEAQRPNFIYSCLKIAADLSHWIHAVGLLLSSRWVPVACQRPGGGDFCSEYLIHFKKIFDVWSHFSPWVLWQKFNLVYYLHDRKNQNRGKWKAVVSRGAFMTSNAQLPHLHKGSKTCPAALTRARPCSACLLAAPHKMMPLQSFCEQ